MLCHLFLAYMQSNKLNRAVDLDKNQNGRRLTKIDFFDKRIEVYKTH